MESYNLKDLNSLVSNDVSALLSFISLFIKEVEGKEIPLIEKSVGTQDVKVLKRSAHSLKSNLKLFGYVNFSVQCKELENELEESQELSEYLIKKLNLTVFKLKVVCSQLKVCIDQHV